MNGVEEDARKMGRRNWLADARDRGRWQHLHEEAKAQPGLQSHMMMMMVVVTTISPMLHLVFLFTRC
jgi:hypothetical protein